MRAMSWASWTESAESIAQPVLRQAITSLWSPKMERAWVATVRAVTWKTVEVSSPAILNMLGIISSKPCDAVKVVVKAPACSEPWTAPAAPASLCISTTLGIVPKMFFRPAAAQASGISPRFDDGVIG